MTTVFLHFLNLSITAGWMVLAVLLLRLCLKKAPRWITCVLWGLVALRLILPFTIESPISLIPTPKTVVSTDGSDSATPVVDSGLSAIDKPLNDWLQKPVDAPVEKPSQSPVVQSPLPQTPPSSDVVINGDKVEPKPDVVKPVEPTPEEQKPSEQPSSPAVKTVSRMEKILNVVAPVWLVGIGLMLIYELLSILRIRRRVWDAVRLRDNVWQSDRVASPFIFGLFRPRIYVPYGLEEPVLEQVLSHERAHLHRRDHWIKPFAFTLLAVYWYNPLLWVGYILLCRDIEVACDERVVRGLDEDTRRQYATALLQCGVERRSIAACPLAFGEVSIKQRIKSVLNYRKPLLWVIIASLVVCAVAAVCLLTVPKSKPADSKPKDSSTEEEEPIVVLSSKVIKPDQVRQFFSQDTDGALVEAGCNWMWEHAENPDQQTPDIEYWEETNVPLVVSHSKADLDALMDACSDDEWDQVDMRYWFELEKYDDAYFEDKVIVWLHVPGYSLGHYDYAVTLEETNKGLRYAVSVEYESTSMFNPWTNICEYLLLFETDRKLIEEADSLTTRHEKAPFELPEEDGLTMVPVGNVDLDGDGEKEEIRLYHSELNLDTGWDSGYETAYLVVCKADGTVLLREETFYYEHSQCYLVTQEDGSSLLLFVEARDLDYAYPDEEFGVLSLKGGERTVVQRRYDGKVYPNNLDVGDVISYVSSLSGWLEDAQLLFGCEKGSLYYGDEIGNTPRYTPLCWLDEYRESADDTLQDILENIIASLNGDIVSIGDIDFNHDGQLDSLFVFGYTYGSLDMCNTCLLVKEADGTILTGFHISTYYSDSDTTVYLYRVTDDQGKERLQEVTHFADGTCHVSDLSMEIEEGYRSMTMAEWLDHVEETGAKLICYMQGMELHFPVEDTSDNFLNEDVTKYTVVNYNPSIVAYNAFLKGQRVAHEYGEIDTTLYVSDLYATVNDKGIKRYSLADVTGDGVPELITYGYEWNIFTYQSGRVLRLYKSAAGLYPTRLLSNGCLWEERLGGGNYYRYTKFFEIGTTHTVEFGDPGYDTDEDKYHVDGVWMNKADFDAKTATYFENAKKPALLIWYNYATKQPHSQAMVQYLSLLQNVYQNNSSAYYALHDADGDGTQELLVKVGENVVVGLPQSNPTLSNEKGIEWVSFKDEPVYTVDMTFDGFQDVAVFAEDCAYSKSYAVLRWDVDKERLVLIPTFLENPAVDTSISKIRTSRSGDQIVSYSMWDYDEEKKDFVRTHSLYFEKNEQSTSDSDNMKLVVTENGQTETLYVRGEPYALDKTDPQVAPYYAPNSLWCLYSDRWEYYIFAQDVDELSYNTYALLLQEEYDNQVWLRTTCRDLNGDGQDELLLLEDGTNRLIVYTMKDGYTHLLVNQGFASGTSRFLDTGDADYPGIIYFCVGGGKDRYYYLTLDNVQDGEFVEIPLWTDNYAFYDEGEEGRITELSDDKKLIELSRKAYEQNKDLYFSLFVTEGHEDWVKHAYGSSIKQHNSKPDAYRDLGELQPETNDVVLLDGQQYQSYVASTFDMRYIFVSNKEYDMAAQWDWVPIGTCDDYSLDNLGKIDDSQRGIPVELSSVLDNRQSFEYLGETVFLSDLLADYDDAVGRCAVVDMDGDDKPELALEFKSLNYVFVLKKDDASCYGHLFSIRAMQSIHADGTFDWASGAGYTGCSRIRFDGDTYEIVDLWYKDEGYSYGHYYVDGKAVSEEYYRSVTSTAKEEVQWYTWP